MLIAFTVTIKNKPYNLVIFKSDKSTLLFSCFLKFLTGYKTYCIAACICKLFSSLDVGLLDVTQRNHFTFWAIDCPDNTI